MIFHNTILLSKKGVMFFKYHVISILLFSFLYYIQDKFLDRYPELSKKLRLGESTPPTNNFFYWLWFSAITQTTIGYNGPASQAGASIDFSKNKNKLFKLLNITQIFSIFLITAYLIQ